jgi:uncharacterized protein (DUF433 family)
MTQDTIRYTERISQDPEVLVGKPVIRGTRISVELILERLSGNFDLDELFAAYPRLTIEDVQAVLAFAQDAVRSNYLRSRHRKEALGAGKTKSELATSEA